MKFTKMEGIGNDFVVLSGPLDLTGAEVEALCDRRRGIGADGVLVVTSVDESTVRMEYWNADGSAAEMCGNGLRCVGRYAVDEGLVAVDTLTVETPTGARRVEVGDDAVRAELGPVEVGGDMVVAERALQTASVGNPHAVLFVDAPEEEPVESLGTKIGTAPAFTNGTNVEFARVAARDLIELRVWERGVGETLACGSGAAATVAVARANGSVDDSVRVRLPGGEVIIELIDGTAWITGPATSVYSGKITL